MKQEFSERLNEAMQAKNISQAQLVEKTGIGKSTMSQYLSGKYKAKQDNITKIAEALHISPAWLMGIDTEMEKPEESLEEIFAYNLNKFMVKYDKDIDDVAKACNVKKKEILKWTNAEKIPAVDIIQRLAIIFDCYKSDLTEKMGRSTAHPRGVRIPVLGRVVAGIPIEAIEEILDYEEISESTARTGDYFALQVKGDSMEPRMYEGDVVIVRKQETAQTGDVAIVLVNGDEATVKKIRIMDSGIMLIPFNTKYDPWIYTAEDIERLPVKIIGKVVECRQKY